MTMTTRASLSLCAVLLARLAPRTALAFATGGSRAVRGVPISNRNEWQAPGAEIELPDLELLFDRVAAASPLARLVMEGDSSGGFDSIDDNPKHTELKWKKVEENKRRTVHRIDKTDRFQNVKTPLLRFRSSMEGPCIGERFSHMMMDLEERKKWDDQIASVGELYPIDDTDAVDSLLGNTERYGTCARVGVGYMRTKQGILSPREQLILGGMQQFDDGAAILWGTEMEDRHNHLLPEGRRHTRARTHLSALTLVPTGASGFDVEYLLQVDVGGGIPHFMTTPAITDAVKRMFEHARKYFEGGEGSELDMFLESQRRERADSEIKFSNGVEKYLLDAEIDLSEVDPRHHAMIDNKGLLFTP